MDLQQHLLDRVTEIGEGQVRTEQAVNDLIARFDRVTPFFERLNDKIETKADESDLKALVEKHEKLSSRVSWIRGIGTAAGAFLTLAIAGLAAWWTGHPPAR